VENAGACAGVTEVRVTLAIVRGLDAQQHAIRSFDRCGETANVWPGESRASVGCEKDVESLELREPPLGSSFGLRKRAFSQQVARGRWFFTWENDLPSSDESPRSGVRDTGRDLRRCLTGHDKRDDVSCFVLELNVCEGEG
jgi:hypothetical protein